LDADSFTLSILSQSRGYVDLLEIQHLLIVYKILRLKMEVITMATITEHSRELGVRADVDVVVCGGGPGGLPAAVAAARHGARTLLIERYGFLGGLATAGLVAPILGHTASKSTTPIVEGILKEITERMHALDGAPSWQETCREWGIKFNAEAFKRAADEMIEEAGANLLLHTLVTDTITENDMITALIIESKSGRQAVKAKVVIDATGDADVAFRSGAATRQGRDFDGRVQSMGSFMHIGGISGLGEEQKAAAKEMLKQIMADGSLHFYNNNFTGINTMHSDHFSPNMTRWPGDPTDVSDLTRAELDVRRDAWKLISFLKKEAPGFENCYLRLTSPQVGPRESRQVMGDYMLTGDDILQGRKFKDAVARGSWWIDIHCPLGRTYPVHLCMTECPEQEKCPFWAAEHDKTMFAGNNLYTPDNDWYDIPYRCLTPNRIGNLLVSGRCISATHEAMAGARIMGTCMAIGQAAGTAAAMAVQASTAPREVDVSELRRMLRSDGALV
jgi:ribulose 1,5-bisphosphate synthetase/thiazole synthase